MKKDVVLNEESGQGTFEYALIIAILSILAIGTWELVGNAVTDMFGRVMDGF